MSKDQKEVFDALNSENEDGIYDKLVLVKSYRVICIGK